ncbi:MAG: trigger factor [Clostridiales bacterium]|nr:trigger factor [Clostridiales bacterium]
MSTVEALEKNKVKITFSVDAARFEEGMEHSYKKNRNQLSLQGFRKGKVPRKMLEIAYGKEVFYEDAVNFVLPDAYETAVKETETKVVSRPEIDIEKIDDEGVVFTAEVFVKPEVKIENYKGLKYLSEDTTVTDEEVNAVVDAERSKQARIFDVTDRNAETGDTVNIDFKGYIDDVPFEGGEGASFDLELGSHTFIDNFEDQIVGAPIGSELVVNVTFPENYGAPDLAGKPAKFEVKVNSIKGKEIPELDDEYVSDTTEFESVDEYLTDVRAKLTMNKVTEADNRKREQLIEELGDVAEIDVPECMYDNEVDKMFENFANSLRYRGLPVEQHLQMINQTEDAIKDSFREQAEKQVKGRLALEKIAEIEAFEITEEELDNEIDRIAKESMIEKEKLLQIMSIDEKESLKDDLKVQKALDLVLSEAVVSE